MRAPTKRSPAAGAFSARADSGREPAGPLSRVAWMVPLALLAPAAGPARVDLGLVRGTSPRSADQTGAGRGPAMSTLSPSRARRRHSRGGRPAAGRQPRRAARAGCARGAGRPRLRARRPGDPGQGRHGYDVPLITLASVCGCSSCISGYVISRPCLERLSTGEPLPSLPGYGRRRAARIFPLYWVALGAFIVSPVARALQPGSSRFTSSSQQPRSRAARRVFSVAWTLTIEVLFYVCVPALAF